MCSVVSSSTPNIKADLPLGSKDLLKDENMNSKLNEQQFVSNGRRNLDVEKNEEISIRELEGERNDNRDYGIPSVTSRTEKDIGSQVIDTTFTRATPRKNSSNCYARHRTCFTYDQLLFLEGEYARDEYLSKTRRSEISNILRLPENTVKVWFQNRRMKSKRRRMESLSKSLDSVFKRINANAQTYVHQIQPSSPLSPAVFYQPAAYKYPEYTYPAYIAYHNHANTLQNTQYHSTAPEYRYGSYTSPGLSNLPPIQALEAQVLNCCRNCTQTFTQKHDTNMNMLNTLTPPENASRSNETQFLEKYQQSNIAVIEPMSFNNVLTGNMQTNRSQDLVSNIKEGRGKFFRPFEDK